MEFWAKEYSCARVIASRRGRERWAFDCSGFVPEIRPGHTARAKRTGSSAKGTGAKRTGSGLSRDPMIDLYGVGVFRSAARKVTEETRGPFFRFSSGRNVMVIRACYRHRPVVFQGWSEFPVRHRALDE